MNVPDVCRRLGISQQTYCRRRTLGHEKVSERRVCRVLGQNRGTQRNRPRKVDGDRELLSLMRKIVETFPRHGSERTHQVLTGPDAFGGWRGAVDRPILTARRAVP
jgi:hypothetical protein